MNLQNLLEHVDQKWQKDFINFIDTGEANPDFLKYLNNDKQAQEAVEKLPEHDEVEALKEQLKAKREVLKQAMLRAPGLNDLQQQLADEKDALKQARLNLSVFLLGYFHETGQQSIELEPQDTREIILKGRLKKTKDQQVSIFNQENEQ